MYRRMKGTIVPVESNSLGHSRSLNGIGKKHVGYWVVKSADISSSSMALRSHTSSDMSDVKSAFASLES